jgi:two-component system, NarL family, response regulator LiaR
VPGTRSASVGVISQQPVVRAGFETILRDVADPIRVVTAAGPIAWMRLVDVLVYDTTGVAVDRSAELRRAVGADVPVLVTGFGSQASLECVRVVAQAQRAVSARARVETLRQAVADLLPLASFPSRDPVDLLSERELTVLSLIATGLSNAEVAASTYVSINTVKSYVRTAYRKIGVDRRSMAVLWAVQNGLADSPLDDDVA